PGPRLRAHLHEGARPRSAVGRPLSRGARGRRAGDGALKKLLLVLLVVLALFAGATAYLFLWPDEDAPPRGADAVVVLSGGRGHRLAEGRRLIREGISKTLVISDGLAPSWDEANGLCRTHRAVCFKPD